MIIFILVPFINRNKKLYTQNRTRVADPQLRHKILIDKQLTDWLEYIMVLPCRLTRFLPSANDVPSCSRSNTW